jgi:hypothetical protein
MALEEFQHPIVAGRPCQDYQLITSQCIENRAAVIVCKELQCF